MSLSDDELALVDQLQQEYAAHLYDYLRRFELDADQALAAVAGALLSALRHAGRPVQPEQLRAWLYGLARAHRTAVADAAASDAGAWSTPGPLAGPLCQAMAALPAGQREALDLSVRHGLTGAEIALIFSMDARPVETLITEAADLLEACAAAISAASTGLEPGGCRQLADLISPDTATAASGTEISRHVSTCGTCQATPRPITADHLLQHVPIQAAPDSLADHLAQAAPLSDDEQLWRPDGFPIQTGPLLGPSSVEPASNAAPGGAERSSQPVDDPDEFRAWEERGQAAAEFWRARPDESNPEASLSLRPMLPALRVGSLIVAVVVAVAIAGAVWQILQPSRPTTVAQASAPRPASTITLITTEPPPEPALALALEEPPTLAPSEPPHRRTTVPTTRPTRTASTRRPSAQPTRSAPTVATATRPASKSAPDDPPRQSTTSRPRSSPSTRALPKPAPPAASVSPSSITLGSGRSGSVSLAVSPGTGAVVSASGSSGISVSGTSFTVSAPRQKPGCSTMSESGTITLTWRGTTTGDGRSTAGTTTGGGTLTVHVTWTVEADQGHWIPTGSVGHVGSKDGYWSNCPNGR